MNKKIIEFSKTDDEDEFQIEVSAYGLTADEFKKIRTELDCLDFQYQYIEKDSIQAKFTSSYDETMEILRSFEHDDWSW